MRRGSTLVVLLLLALVAPTVAAHGHAAEIRGRVVAPDGTGVAGAIVAAGDELGWSRGGALAIAFAICIAFALAAAAGAQRLPRRVEV